MRGRLRDRHGTLARVAMDAAASARCKPRGRKRSQRTAKSCGPGAATLALRRREFLADNGGKKGRSPGRARISRKTIARGKPGCPGCTCQNRVHSSLRSAHGAAGAVGARLSLRPCSKGATRLQNSGKSCRGNENACFPASDPQGGLAGPRTPKPNAPLVEGVTHRSRA
jgi:hypothetical protein